jgi:hypothetical protein
MCESTVGAARESKHQAWKSGLKTVQYWTSGTWTGWDFRDCWIYGGHRNGFGGLLGDAWDGYLAHIVKFDGVQHSLDCPLPAINLLC